MLRNVGLYRNRKYCRLNFCTQLSVNYLHFFISPTIYTVFQKSDAKIEITITMTNLIRIRYPLSSFNCRLSVANVAYFNKIHCTVFEQQLFKNGTQKQKFPIWKSRLSSSYAIPSVTVYAQSGHHLHRHLHVLCRLYVLCCCRTSCLQTL